MKVSIVVPVYNNWHASKAGISSLYRLLARDDVHELLILDNHSDDETRKALGMVSNWPKTTLIHEDANLGCGGARSKLFAMATGDRLLSLDADTIVVDPIIIEQCEAAINRPHIGVVGCCGGILTSAREWSMLPRSYVGAVDAVSGYCQYHRRETLQAIDLDPQFYQGGQDDSDVCLQIATVTGLASYMMPLPVLHTWSHTSKESQQQSRSFVSKWVSQQPKRVFRSIYRTNGWGAGSGPGSETGLNQPYRDAVKQEIDRLNAATILDAGCGDGRALCGCDFGSARYIGIDVVSEPIQHARKRLYPGCHFKQLDLLEAPVSSWPRADILLLKDVLQHWPIRHIVRVLADAIQQYRSVLVVNCSVPVAGYGPVNSDITMGQFRPIDLAENPFHYRVTTLGRYATTKRIDRIECP